MNEKAEDRGPQGSTSEGGMPHELRRKAIETYDDARESVVRASRRASGAIEEAPLLALAGGFAAGALIAALLPRSETEAELLGPVSKKLSDGARSAADAAREAGNARLKELGLTADAGRDALRNVVEGLGDAARTSAQAAVGAVRGE